MHVGPMTVDGLDEHAASADFDAGLSRGKLGLRRRDPPDRWGHPMATRTQRSLLVRIGPQVQEVLRPSATAPDDPASQPCRRQL